VPVSHLQLSGVMTVHGAVVAPLLARVAVRAAGNPPLSGVVRIGLRLEGSGARLNQVASQAPQQVFSHPSLLIMGLILHVTHQPPRRQRMHHQPASTCALVSVALAAFQPLALEAVLARPASEAVWVPCLIWLAVAWSVD